MNRDHENPILYWIWTALAVLLGIGPVVFLIVAGILLGIHALLS